MSSAPEDLQRDNELHREAVRLAIRELHGSTGPIERRLKAHAQGLLAEHLERLEGRVARFLPEVIIQGMPEPYQAPVRSRFRRLD